MIQQQHLKIALFCAAAAMLLPLPVMQYVGEESWYTMSAYEMFVNQKWWHQTLFGHDLDKPPMFNWLVIAVSQLIGWQHLEIAPRIVSVVSTWSAAWVVFMMARRFYPASSQTPWLAALIYLTMGEVSFWYGWLGYADATFGFFIFAAIAALWVAIEDQRMGWFLTSLILISVAFLVKNFSCYGIYGMAGIILMQRHHRWRLLLNPLFLGLGILGLAFPWAYQHFMIGFGSSTSDTVIHGALNFKGFGILDYISHWLSYPALFIGRAFPITLLLVWFFWRERQRYIMDYNMITLLWILICCLAPFWISAGATPRYLVPFYGLFALLLTGLLLQCDQVKLKLAFKILIIVIIIKIPYSFLALPYLKDWRPERDIRAVAEEIISIKGSKTLLTCNGVSVALSIASHVNVSTPHDEYVKWFRGKETQVYILTMVEKPKYGEMIKHWRLQGAPVYLYWRP